MTREQMKESLESLIDRAPEGVEGVLELVVEICYEKADHVQTNWQDLGTAQWWAMVANKLDGLRGKL